MKSIKFLLCATFSLAVLSVQATVILKNGRDFNVTIKRLVNPQAVARDSSNFNLPTPDETIQKIIFIVNSKSKDGVVISALGSKKKAYATYDATSKTATICTSESEFLAPHDFSFSFTNFKALKEICNLTALNTIIVTNMGHMFASCSSLISLDLSNFNTSKVTTMRYMFKDCSSLTSLNVSNFDTRNATDMATMFSGCSSLTSLDLSNFDTSKVTAMVFMFSGCSSLTSLDLSNFDTRNVTTMVFMFSGCSSLTSLDLSNFDTRNVTYMKSMFSICSNLTSLNLGRNFDISMAEDITSMGIFGTKTICEITCTAATKAKLLRKNALHPNYVTWKLLDN